MELKQIRAYELSIFLKIPPSKIPGDPKAFLKTQRVRIALEKSVADYKKAHDDFNSKNNEEVIPFVEMSNKHKAEYEKADPESKKNLLTPEQYNKELDAELVVLMKPFQDKLDQYIKDHKDEIKDIITDPNDLDQVKLYFEKEGHNYWISGDAYLEVAKFLGAV